MSQNRECSPWTDTTSSPASASPTTPCGCVRTRQGLTYLSFTLLHVNLVAEDDERKVLGIMWTRLDEELVPPAVQRLERLCAVDIVYEHTTIRSSVVSHTERLEALLPSRIPEL